MDRQHSPRMGNALGAAFIVGCLAMSGCGSDAPASTGQVSTVGAGRSSQLPSHPPPPRPQTKEACDACGGLWGVHGIDTVDSCICRTKDAGKHCADGRECAGQCIVAHDAAFNVTENSDPPRGFYTGTCSEYDTTFGCNLIIPPDIDDQLPLRADEAVQYLCID